MGSSKRNKGGLDWVKELSEAYAKTGKAPKGDGWKTFRELKDEMGMSKDRLQVAMAQLAKEGRLESFTGSDDKGLMGNQMSRQVWYRIIDK